MAAFRFKLKPGAVPKIILKSPKMGAKLVKEAKRATAGMDVEVSEPFTGANRTRVTIHPNSKRGEEQLRARFGK